MEESMSSGAVSVAVASTNGDLVVLEKLLQSRIDVAQEEINALRSEISTLSASVKNSRERMGKKHRESLEEVLQLAGDLERNHSIQVQTNASERAFMREMSQLKQKRKDVAEYNVAKTKLDEMRDKLTELIKDRGAKETSLEELYAGIRRVRGAIKCGCTPAEIEEFTMTVPAEKIASIIGRGGAQLKLIENISNAVIDIDKSSSGAVRIVGLSSSIASATAAIATIVDTTVEEWEVAEEAVTCLLLNRGELITEVQDAYNVKIDTNRAKRTVKITGLDSQVQLARQIIRNIDCRKVVIPVTVDLLPAIVGKGGATIKSMEDECGGGVTIDIDREGNTVTVQGYRTNVDQVAGTIRNIISENKEIEETIGINKQFNFESIIGPGGSIIRTLQKEWGVNLVLPKLDSSVDDYDPVSLVMKGPTNKVIVAKAAVIRMWHEYLAKFTEFEVPLACVPMIVGKKGAKIKSFREAYPGVNIAIVGSKVRLQGENENDRLSIKAAIEAVVDENYTATFTLDNLLAVLLKSAPGAATREMLQQGNVFFEITAGSDDEDASIELRGPRSNVDNAIRILNSFVQSHYFERLSLEKEDFISVTASNRSAPNAPAFLTRLEKQYGVNVSLLRKENAIRVFGSKDNVSEVLKDISAFLTGSDPARFKTIVMAIPEDVVSAIVGKAGATINQFQKDNNVKVDILKSKGILRMELTADSSADALANASAENNVSRAGSNNDHAASAVQSLTKAVFAMKVLIGDIRLTTSVDLHGPSANGSAVEDEKDGDANANEDGKESGEGAVENGANANGNASWRSPEDIRIDTIIRNVKSKYDVDLNRQGKSKLAVRGRYYEVRECVTALTKLLFDTCKHVVEVSPRQLDVINASGKFKALQSRYATAGVAIESTLRVNVGEIIIAGTAAEADKAKAELFRLLDSEFPSEFLSVVMPMPALKELGNFPTLLALEQTTAANLRCDKDCSCVRVRGSVESVSLAVHLLQASLSEWTNRHKSLKIDEWILKSSQNPAAKSAANKSTTPSFLPKLSAVEKDTGARILLNRADLVLEISADNKSSAEAALEQLKQYIELVASERWETTLPAAYMGAFIGKDGSKLNKMREEHGVDINIDKKTGAVLFTGPVASIEAVKVQVKQFLKEEDDRNYKLEIPIPSNAAFPVIIGPKGATVRDIQEMSGCKMDLNRDKRVVVLRGRYLF
jgi:polyribonucleotide nucleotidyltransferase